MTLEEAEDRGWNAAIKRAEECLLTGCFVWSKESTGQDQSMLLAFAADLIGGLSKARCAAAISKPIH